MSEVRKIHGGDREKEGKRANWSRWLLAGAAAAAIASAVPSCSNTEEGPIPIPPVSTDGGVTNDGGSDGGGCVPNPSPACFNNSFEVTLSAGSETSVGDLKIRMLGTQENGSGVEVADFEIFDSCGGSLKQDDIREGETKTYQVTGTDLEVKITAVEVTITNPAATLSVEVTCLRDAGTTDGGTGGADGGAGGMDGGAGGMDSGTGGTTDSGTGGSDGGSGGMDAGTGGFDSGTGGLDSGSGGSSDGGSGGMDAGVSDGGSTTDSGSGGMDSGAGGMDSGTTTDGGSTTDSGTGGSDGGSGGMDSGMGGMDGGGTACGTATTGSWTGNIANGANHTVGGYVFTYNGPDSGNALISVACDGNPTGSYSLPEDFLTTINLPADGKSLKITPHYVSGISTNISIQVVNYP